jgi:DNA-binding NarL/FixJ family response regulator/DNA-directed RNA polymerase specialized sigma24 family protein
MVMARQIRVLLVDDHTTFRQALRTELEAFDNIQIIGEASNGEDAVVSAAKLQPTVVVIDINMPKMDGITATRLIKAQNPEIVVVGFSVDAKDYQLYAMQKVGALTTLSKDTPVTELYGALQEAVAAVRPILVLEAAEGAERVDNPDLSLTLKEAKDTRPATLGDVLYAKSKAPVPEQDWKTLVQSIAAGDQLALYALYDRAHSHVFTLIMRITAHRETAEELTIDVFHDVWRLASRYDATNGTVLGWIMNQARSLTIDRLPLRASDVLRPTTSLQARLALRIAEETGQPPVLPSGQRWCEPEWEQVAPGIECKLLATDEQRHLVSMLVRLAPGASYPGHTHAGIEELHLLEGELWIDQHKLVPGDYNYAVPGTGDDRVWSETGCTCVLITSIKDVLR